MTQSLEFYTNAERLSRLTYMDLVCAHTKNCSFTIWFSRKGVEFNVSRRNECMGYSYSSKYPLPIHNILIKRYRLADQIKQWSESHDET